MTKTFSQTSNEPYIRHDYKVHFTNKKPVLFDNYEDVYKKWRETPSHFLDYVEVIDKKKSNKKVVIGFK